MTLIGLGGRALLLADDGRITEPSRYFQVVRAQHAHVGELAYDIARAIDSFYSWRKYSWMEWEREGAEYMKIRATPERYPLTWFVVRLMELSTEPNQRLDLCGSAAIILRWFESSSASLAAHVRGVPASEIGQRCEYATAALRAAACREHREEMAEDDKIIGTDLSKGRVSEFEASVCHAATIALNSIERIFERTGACLRIPSDAEPGLGKFRIHSIKPKALFADLPENVRTPDHSRDDQDWGGLLSSEVIKRFCETLDEAPETTTSLDTPKALLRAIDKAIEDIDPLGKMLIVLAGDWSHILTRLSMNPPDGYEPRGKRPEIKRSGEIARYVGHQILKNWGYEERRLYVVELKAWGRLVLAKVNGDRGIVVKVNPISAERAQALLNSEPLHFAEEPDDTSKIRKLQTCVEIVVSAHAEFRVNDPSRARRIVGVQ